MLWLLMAFSPYHRDLILGPISNPKYLPFFRFPPKKSQSEGEKNLTGEPV